MSPLKNLVGRMAVLMVTVSFCSSCASVRETNEVFHGFYVGERITLNSKALVYDCGGKNLFPKCFHSASQRTVGGDDGDPYSGTTSFEVVDRNKTQGVDATLTSIEVKNTQSGELFWTTAYEELFEKSPER